ncbi:condensation domain-containing protein, partial [Pedobacter cryoconitis]
MINQNLADVKSLLEKANDLGIEIFLEDDDLIVETLEETEIDEDFWDELKKNKPHLITYFKENTNLSAVDKIQAVSTGMNRIPLSFSQERLWFIDQLEGSVPYHITEVLELHGELSEEALVYALQTIINRHEVLRTVIRQEDGLAYQVVLPADSWQLSAIEAGEDIQQAVAAFRQQTFDLAADHMLRAGLLGTATGGQLLVITIHHIASDGWSSSIIV